MSSLSGDWWRGGIVSTQPSVGTPSSRIGSLFKANVLLHLQIWAQSFQLTSTRSASFPPSQGRIVPFGVLIVRM